MGEQPEKKKKGIVGRIKDTLSGKADAVPTPPEGQNVESVGEGKTVSVKPRPAPNVAKMSYGELLKAKQKAQADRARQIREGNGNT